MNWIEWARKCRPYIVKAAATLPDEDAIEAPMLYEPWQSGKAYEAGDTRYRYGDKLYRCVQSHTSQADWTPDVTPNLWTEVSIEEWPEWVQPTGAQDAYRIGDKVSHNGKHWICESDYNIYEPGVFGWTEAV